MCEGREVHVHVHLSVHVHVHATVTVHVRVRVWVCACVNVCYAFTSCMFPTYKRIFNIPEWFINIICSTKGSTLMCLHSRPNSLSHINNQQYKNILNILQKHAHYYEHRELYMIPVKITKGFFDRVRF